MRLIDADTLLAEYDKIHIGEPGMARKLITEQPTIDAVEVVRCKDCKYYNPIGVCIEMSSAVCEDSFCCWAERRTDG